jgi:hypothetical protein
MMAPAGGVRLPRGAVVGLCVAGALLLAALLGGPPGRDGPPLYPRSDGPLGTSALVSLLRGLGADVELSVGLPGPNDEVALVLRDRLDDAQAAELRDWVRQGGTLVITDPMQGRTPPVVDQGVIPDTGPIAPGSCSIPALSSVGEVEGGAAVRFDALASDQICFGDRRDGAFVVTHADGAGEIVAVGGAAFLTNDLLDERDNAVLAATLLAPSEHTTVRFVDAPIPAGGGDKTLGDLVPGGVKRALVQLALAFVVYALWRAIRLGQPVREDQPVELAGSELVGAVGRLLSRTNEPGAAAETLRAGLRRSLRTRLGVPVDAPVATLAEITAARTGANVEDVLVAIDERPVTSDAELVAVARAVASIHEEALT